MLTDMKVRAPDAPQRGQGEKALPFSLGESYEPKAASALVQPPAPQNHLSSGTRDSLQEELSGCFDHRIKCTFFTSSPLRGGVPLAPVSAGSGLFIDFGQTDPVDQPLDQA